MGNSERVQILCTIWVFPQIRFDSCFQRGNSGKLQRNPEDDGDLVAGGLFIIGSTQMFSVWFPVCNANALHLSCAISCHIHSQHAR